MDEPAIPWLPVFGYGSHIKATAKELIIAQGSSSSRYPLGAVEHLLLVGGHTLHTSAVVNLLKAGSAISFFDIEGKPVGYLRPPGYARDECIREAQNRAAPHRYAHAAAVAAAKSRLLFIEKACEASDDAILYQGEHLLLHQSTGELEHMITMAELRRLHRLTADMYYEILSRMVPGGLGYRRRASRPYRDPVNAMLSLGYSMLFGNCCVSVIGAHLDPDRGMLHEGAGSLVYDIIEPLKVTMVDRVVLGFARELAPEDYECGLNRCYLADGCARRLTKAFHASIDQKSIDTQVSLLLDALMQNREYQVLY
ncbi:CRISPR-associated endonuclease Cas1 [Methanoculleus sp. FWC-SCC1]|uniref:CRISPR-associated endonuclease Cas1 n=1 Tax=Methanoculleus frigidifontis TaxID=2584085 RepID=A0ABT8MC12_9EURY|nr:CRISPR-associated endonuclease Cas1 [Methanoculleus sp. FWC-SCC1]MDN7025415.1 CRISPR-associated endonuclease Cas1 [Methanoculleus sp. FWC-SCC1]